MQISDWLTVLGGLALFLYGIYLMGEGLRAGTNGVLERVLDRLAGTPCRAVLCGAFVTALVQSSSAVTVMVVGLADAGVMKLDQAAGVIMGANIGTTVTAWILGLAGMESSSFPAGFLNPASFAPVLGLVGVAVLMGSGRPGTKKKAVILVAFSILMFGMDAMSRGVRPLASVPEFAGMLTKFTHPLWGLLAGMGVTALIQSSSASVGILQVLCSTGAVSYGAAVPIILGQNIGSCVTALLAGVGAGRNAKRAALVHLYFNVIGAGIFLTLFYGIHAVRAFSFLTEAADSFGVAFIHSAFNIGATLLLLPFTKKLVRLACLTLPGEDKKRAPLIAGAPIR